MPSLMSYLTGFGLASGAGAKAAIPVLMLGGLHYTEWFELSERFAWIASPPVMIVLAVLVVVEIAVDASPELAEHAALAEYLPKAAAGFIAFAAATGDVDQSLIELGGSGLLGATTASAAHFLRNGFRNQTRHAEDIHEAVPRTLSLGEAGVSAVVAGSAVIAPVVAVGMLAMLVVGAILISRAIDRRRVPCAHCGQPIRPGALVCIHCKQEQAEAPESIGA